MRSLETEKPRSQLLEAAMRVMDQADVVQVLIQQVQELLLKGEPEVNLTYHGYDIGVYVVSLRLSNRNGVRVTTMPNNLISVSTIGPTEMDEIQVISQDDPGFNEFLARLGETRGTADASARIEYALGFVQE